MIGSVSFTSVSPVAPAREVRATGPGSTPAAGPSWATISQSGALLSRLQQLAESDPSKLQAALGRVSQDLRSGAQHASGTQAEILQDLADRFERAASGGDLSSLVLSAASHHKPYALAPDAGGLPSAPTDPTAQATLDSVLAQVDPALGMNPPPLGPWFTL